MEKNTKEEIRNLIFAKIEKIQRNEQTLKKFFVFNSTDLKDDYEGCIEVIEDYLDQHKDKVMDFEFETWIDEITMQPVLMMKLYLIQSMSIHLSNNHILNNLLPSSVEADILREEISEIFHQHSFEFNKEEARKSIISRIKFKLPLIEIEDRTSEDDIDNQRFNFVIKKNGQEMSLNDYIESIANIGRFEQGKSI
jgi:hypothetical protein